MRIIIAVSALLAGIAVARAEEKPVPIKNAPGSETVENTCGACHSLDYIRTNAPFMTEQVWQAEVNKMINAFGAPATPEEAKTIVDYLVKNYGKPG
jgi:cytochrome c5